jgi:hypothetical protein
LQLAREKADQLVSKDAIIQGAQSRAAQLIEQARIDNDVARKEVDLYVINSLYALENELGHLINQVRNGIKTLEPETEPQKAEKTEK